MQKLEPYESQVVAVVEMVFSWLLYYRVPLTTSAFVQAISWTLEDQPLLSTKLILDLCFNLVVVDKDLDIFRFAHLSVQEYLQSKEVFHAAFTHSRILLGCLGHLTSRTLRLPAKMVGMRSPGVTRQQNGLQVLLTCAEFYICLFWPTHLNLSNDHGHRDPVSNKLLVFFRTGFAAWVDIAKAIISKSFYDTRFSPLLIGYDYHRYLKLSQPLVTCPNPLSAVAVLGCAEVLEKGLNVDLDALCNGIKPLTWACYHGHLDVIQWMLRHGANPNEQSSNLHYSPPLVTAIQTQNVAMTDILLSYGALGTTVSEYYRRRISCSWHATGKYLDFVRHMISRDIDIDLWDILLELPPYDAQSAGVIDLLASRTNTVNLGTYLWRAVKNGHLVMAEVIIKHGACLSDKSLVLLAVENCNYDMLDLLLSNDAKFDTRRSNDPIPIKSRRNDLTLTLSECDSINQIFASHGIEYGLPNNLTEWQYLYEKHSRQKLKVSPEVGQYDTKRPPPSSDPRIIENCFKCGTWYDGTAYSELNQCLECKALDDQRTSAMIGMLRATIERNTSHDEKNASHSRYLK